jgi:hypothetical protein
VELRGLEPLTSSMPSTVGVCGGGGPQAGNWSPASAVDRDCASGLVSSLVSSVVVSRSTRWVTLKLSQASTSGYIACALRLTAGT